jgi:hypothetical protein
VSEQGEGGGGVAGDRPGFPASLLGGQGDVFRVQVEGELSGCLGEVFGLVAEMAALLAGVVLALVALGERTPAPGARAAEGPSAGVGAVLARPAAAAGGRRQRCLAVQASLILGSEPEAGL